MRISDWSSDVCSSDLVDGQAVRLSNDALIMSLSSFVFIKPGWVGDDNASVVDVELPDSFIWKCLCNSSGSIKRMTKFAYQMAHVDWSITEQAVKGVIERMSVV